MLGRGEHLERCLSGGISSHPPDMAGQRGGLPLPLLLLSLASLTVLHLALGKG